VNFEASKRQEEQRLTKTYHKKYSKIPKKSPKGGGNISNPRKDFRAEGTGRGRGGINPSPGTGVKGFSII